MKRFRIIMRQRGTKFIAYVVERRMWFFLWVRMPIPFDTLLQAREWIGERGEKDSKVYETLIEEL
jgi:hypothetical protein